MENEKKFWESIKRTQYWKKKLPLTSSIKKCSTKVVLFMCDWNKQTHPFNLELPQEISLVPLFNPLLHKAGGQKDPNAASEKLLLHSMLVQWSGTMNLLNSQLHNLFKMVRVKPFDNRLRLALVHHLIITNHQQSLLLVKLFQDLSREDFDNYFAIVIVCSFHFIVIWLG